MPDAVRLSLTVSQELNEHLEELATRSQSTKSAILRKAIVLFDLATEAKAQSLGLGLFDQDLKMVTEIVGI